jgi:hypothetical protein
MNDHPSVHPSERPNLRLIMLFSLVGGVALLSSAAHVDDSDLARLAAAGAWLSFGIFLVTFGAQRVAWVLREHERWREYQAQKSN